MTAAPQREELFRAQVTERRRQRLYGEVVISHSRMNAGIVWSAVALSLAIVAWAVTATYPRTERIEGVVVTDKPSAKVLATRAGVTDQLFVRDGTPVKRGQPLAFVGVDVRDDHQQGAAQASLSALDQQRGSIEERISNEAVLTLEERDKVSSGLQAAASEQQLLRDQLRIQSEIVRSKAEELERIMPMVEKGFVSKVDMNRRRQALLTEQQRASQLSQQIVQIDTRRDELSSRLRRLPVESKGQIAELTGRLGELSQQHARAKVEVGYTIVSPIDGYVTALQTAPGRAVDSRAPLMVVMPKGGNFRVRLFAPSKAAGFLQFGQPVRISYDAFPYKQFGTFGGKVASISRTTYTPEEIDAPLEIKEPVYQIEVNLANEVAPAFGDRLPLQSGMTLSASVILERRSFLDWLLQPLRAVTNRT